MRWLSSGAPFQAPMMTGWEQDVVTKRWRPSAPRAEPLGRRDRRRGGEPRGRLAPRRGEPRGRGDRRGGGEPRGRLPATLLVVDDVCWACRAPVRAIVG